MESASPDSEGDSDAVVQMIETADRRSDQTSAHQQGAGETDIFIAKLSADGTFDWSVRYGGAAGDGVGSESGRIVAVSDTCDIVLAASYRSNFDFDGTSLINKGEGDVAVLRLTAGGTPVSAVVMGGPEGDWPAGLALDAGGNILVSLESECGIDLGGGPLPQQGGNDFVLGKLTGDGTHLWSRRFGDSSTQYAGGIAADPEGAAIFVGELEGTVDFGLGALTETSGSAAVAVKFAP